MSDFLDDIASRAKQVKDTVSDGISTAQKKAIEGYEVVKKGAGEVKKEINENIDVAKKKIDELGKEANKQVEVAKKKIESLPKKVEDQAKQTAEKAKEQALKSALAFFSAAQKGSDAAKNVGVWLWEVIKGDFHEDPTLGQIATGTVISMIPIVDQICDVRDFFACAKMIKEKPDDNMPKVMMAITLIGVIPVAGSLAKGTLKIILSIIRRSFRNVPPNFYKLPKFEKVFDENLEKALKQVRAFFNRTDVLKYISFKKIGDPYKYVAKELEKLISQASKNSNIIVEKSKFLLKQFDDLIVYVQRFGGNSKLVQQALEEQKKLRHFVNNELPKYLQNNEILNTALKMLKKIQRRLEIESDMAFRATVDKNNLGKVWFPYLDELEAIKKKTPKWVDKGKGRNLPHRAHSKPEPPELEAHKLNEGYPDIGDDFKTFAKNTAKATEFEEGEVLYRIVSPGSADNSVCWMRESEFLKLKNKDDWRRYFAVWGSWNSNGEFVTYTVPKGGLKGWEGTVASQTLDQSRRLPRDFDNWPKTKQDEWHKDNAEGAPFSLEGGAKQIVIDPKMLHASNISARKPTGWGYGDDELGHTTNLVGVPVLKNNVEQK